MLIEYLLITARIKLEFPKRPNIPAWAIVHDMPNSLHKSLSKTHSYTVNNLSFLIQNHNNYNMCNEFSLRYCNRLPEIPHAHFNNVNNKRQC